MHSNPSDSSNILTICVCIDVAMSRFPEYGTRGWQTDLFTTPCTHPLKCCYGCFCAPCMAYQQRDELMAMTGEEYYCCLGQFPCCCLKDPCPKVPCQCLEVTCCAALAISSNRRRVQQTYQIRN